MTQIYYLRCNNNPNVLQTSTRKKILSAYYYECNKEIYKKKNKQTNKTSGMISSLRIKTPPSETQLISDIVLNTCQIMQIYFRQCKKMLKTKI